MRLLLINYEYPPVGGGAANATQEIARSLVRIGHEPIVLTSAFGGLHGELDEEGVTVVRARSRRARRDSSSIAEMCSFMAHGFVTVRKIVRTKAIEGIISFFSIPSGPIAWWAWRCDGPPYLVSLRGGDVPGTESSLARIHKVLAPVRRRVLRNARGIVANSEGLRALATAADHLPVAVIPNGVDTTYYRPAIRRTSSSEVPFRLLFVGRFQPQKNLVWLFEQLALFAAERPEGFSLDLMGDGPQGSELRRLSTKLGLDPFLKWHGWSSKPKVLERYQEADAIINPSLYEGMPNVLLEAMSCGVPVIASDVAGNNTVVIPGKTGWLFRLNDSAGFQNALHEVIGNPAAARSIGATARTIAQKSYSWEAVARAYIQLFDSLPQ
jgi:glycosyltransferase involved in cell wall biosynthesis